MQFCLQETTSSWEVKEVGTWRLPVVCFLSPRLLRPGEGPLFGPLLKGPVSGYSQSLAFVLGEIRTKERGSRGWEQKQAQVDGLWAAKFEPPSPSCSWSCDLLFSWTRGSLFLLFFVPFRK